MNKQYQWNIWYLVGAFFLLMLFQSLWTTYRTVEVIPYSQFLKLLDEKKIVELTVHQEQITGRLKEPINGRELFITNRVEPPALAEQIEKSGAKFTGTVENTFLSTLLSWLMPVLFLVGIWYFVFRRFAERQGLGGLVNVGKSKARVLVERDTGVTFDDVAGADEAKAELMEIVSFLKDKDKYGRLGARIPKGVLLVGPPGTGKTLLAKAVAGQAGVPFFSISGSEFVEMFVGVGAARVRDLFEQARKAAPCIIFIDELDALGRARGGGMFGGHDEKEQTLNQLLTELDGFDPREGIVLLGATNRPEVLDPALLRAGRFDRQVVLDRPDRRGREAILRVHIKRIKLAADVRLPEIAGITPGFTGADLANLVNEAAIVATRRGGSEVTTADFTAAVERIVAGSERKGRLLQPHERQVVAYHEMGHALAAANLPGTDPVHKVSIIPRSIGALGYTLQRPTDDRFLITMRELKDRMVVLLAGRAAEDVVFGEVSTGAADDLAKVTDIARQIVTRFGMTEALGQAVLERKSQTYLGDQTIGVREKDYSEETAREVDVAVKQLIDDAYARAKALLCERRVLLEQGARLLLEKETLTPEDFPPLAQSNEPSAKEKVKESA
jgi:cell division protease FtsH